MTLSTQILQRYLLHLRGLAEAGRTFLEPTLLLSPEGAAEPLPCRAGELLSRSQQVLVTAGPGQGKTELLRWLAGRMAEVWLQQGGQAPVPFLLDLRYLRRGEGLAGLATRALATCNLQVGPEEVRQFLRTSPVFLFLDNLDLVGDTHALAEMAAALAQDEGRPVASVVACREGSVDTYQAHLRGHARATLAPWSDAEVRAYVERSLPRDRAAWLLSQLQAQVALWDLVHSPLFLGAAVEVCAGEGKVSLAALTRALVERALARLMERLGEPPAAAGAGLLGAPPEGLAPPRWLAQAAWSLRRSGRSYLSRGELTDLVAAQEGEAASRSLPAVLDAGILSFTQDRTGLRFVHEVVADYFAARALQHLAGQRDDPAEALMSQPGWPGAWTGAMRLLAAEWPDVGNLLRLLLHRDSSDAEVDLVAECLQGLQDGKEGAYVPPGLLGDSVPASTSYRLAQRLASRGLPGLARRFLEDALRHLETLPEAGPAPLCLAESPSGGAGASPARVARALDRGLLLHALGRLEEAREEFQKAGDGARRLLAAARHLEGLVLRDLHRPDDALAAFREALGWDKDRADSLCLAASLLNDMGEHGEAEALLREAQVPAPWRGERLAELGRAYCGLRWPEMALDVLREAVAGAPREARYHVLLAQAWMLAGRWDEAVESLHRALALEPDRTEWRLRLGQAYEAAGRPEEAAEAYRLALEAGTRDAALLFRLGCACQRAGQHERAAQALSEALRRAEEPQAAWYAALGASLEALGQVRSAAAAYQEAVERDASVATYHVALGRVQMALGDAEAARLSLQAAVELDPGSAEAHFLLGRVLEQAGDLEGALFHLQEAARVAPDAPDIHLARGRAALAAGKVAEAEGAFRQALALDPAALPARVGLARSLEASGSLGEAEACL
ncbi:MAG: tetratricopeptide repeat protein, partial [Anaerolineae bacterium]